MPADDFMGLQVAAAALVKSGAQPNFEAARDAVVADFILRYEVDVGAVESVIAIRQAAVDVTEALVNSTEAEIFEAAYGAIPDVYATKAARDLDVTQKIQAHNAAKVQLLLDEAALDEAESQLIPVRRNLAVVEAIEAIGD